MLDDDEKATLFRALSALGLGWYLVMWVLVSIGAIAARRRYRYRPVEHLRFNPTSESPGVSILRPLKGLDANLYTNLESTFRQEYPNLEIIFSVDNERDQALPVVNELLSLYPNVNARVVIGAEDVGVNPKVNNLVRSYRIAAHDILWVLDSNVFVDPGTLARAVEVLTAPKSPKQRRIAVIHHVPFVDSCGSFWGSRIEAAFLNTTHAKMYIAINALAVDSCVVGKSNLYRRSDVDRVDGSRKPADAMDLPDRKTGFATFGRFLAEDNMIASALWHELGLRHDLSTDVAHNVVGNMTLADWFWRRVRWIRVRKYMVFSATILEPFTESIVFAILASYASNYLFNVPKLAFILAHFVAWFLLDLDVYASLSGQNNPILIDHWFILAWLIRETTCIPIYFFAVFGSVVTWRGKHYRIRRNGEAALA
ncbi:glucosylceramide synthase [Coprinellus micaceus]|uniref:Ceramide glucosyltransferase n=1 Tax=Coprinellus micaceus TaxID=71717 RepID=A0A4Y7TY94_COPMI|nr:glucosylceramide synthase [Coprinellus micaceus]